MTEIFIVPFRVSPATASIMPAGVEGTFVSCYAAGDGYEGAVRKCLAARGDNGLTVDEIPQPINAMRSSDWSRHVAEQLPEHAGGLPDQAEFEDRIGRDRVVYGPFGTF